MTWNIKTIPAFIQYWRSTSGVCFKCPKSHLTDKQTIELICYERLAHAYREFIKYIQDNLISIFILTPKVFSYEKWIDYQMFQ